MATILLLFHCSGYGSVLLRIVFLNAPLPLIVLPSLNNSIVVAWEIKFIAMDLMLQRVCLAFPFFAFLGY